MLSIAEYKELASIQEIVFISQTEKKVTVYRRDGYIFSWSMSEYSEGKVVFESIDFKIAMNDIYKRMNFNS